MLEWLLALVKAVVLLAFLLVALVLAVWAERKILADMQSRVGPNRAGPWGILQTLADGLKLMTKEVVVPKETDRLLYYLAPLLAAVPAFLSFSVIPFGPPVRVVGREVSLQLADPPVGVLLVVAVGSVAIYGVILAGWASGSNYPLLGSLRAGAQLISYELAMTLALASVLVYAGSLRVSEIVEAQAGIWFFLPQLPAFLIFLVASLAEASRPPFDLPEAESELVAGYHTEYSGAPFMLFYLAEYLHALSASAVGVTLFFGGWRGPMLPVARPVWGPFWFLAKVVLFVFVFIWLRASLPRFRYDQLMRIGWKILLPFSMGWLLLSSALVALPIPRVLLFRAGLVGLVVLALIWLLSPLFTRARRTGEGG